LSERLRCGGVTIVPAEGRLVGPRGAVHLRPRTMDVLLALTTVDGEVIGSRELLNRVWGEALVSDAVLTNAMSELRRAFVAACGRRDLIETVPRRGYRLTTLVESQEPRPDAARSLAVLPFEDLTPVRSCAKLLEGVHDALVGELAGSRSLRVLARPATAGWSDRPRPLAQIGRELRVQKLVTGSAVCNGARLRINAQLTDLASDRVVWSTSLVVALGDPIELQSSLAGTLARELRRALDLPPSPPRPGTAPLDRRSSELLLRGQLRLRGSTFESLELGLADLEQAIRREPGLAPAHAGLARGFFLRACWGADPGAERAARAEAAAARALSLDPDSIEGRIWWTMTRAFGAWRPADALWELARLVRDHPHNPEARDALAHCLAALGRLSEAIAEERRALLDDPVSPALRTALGFFLRAFGAADEAADELGEALALNPDWTIARLELGRVRLAQGQTEAAAAEIERAQPEWGSFLAALVRGDAPEVQRHLAAWQADAAEAPYWLAERCMWAGERRRALAALERAFEMHQLRVVYLGADPAFAPLRRSPRFQRLVARVGAEIPAPPLPPLKL
jgi:DNA-binding winged helix-turn-helix (wHTH) protein/tetratricopeptide (TPR) repeat protein